MSASGGTVSKRSVAPTKDNMQYMDETTDKAGTLAITEMETAVVQERGHESSQAGKAAGSDTGEPQTACDSAGSETPVQPDGGLRAWIVCLTAMLNYGTVTGLVNSLSLVYVIMLKEFSHGDVSLAFKICKFSACTICVVWLRARARTHTHTHTHTHTRTRTHTTYPVINICQQD